MIAALIMGLIAIILGILVLIKPKLLNISVAVWLLIWGVLQVLNALNIVSISGFAIVG
ncbi:DUF3096 domain-containing protein [Candidatus Pacearchaeota archaeon]|nr:DUF3096 domain-containing protein [Candidatus Pacearchaeota archaeon]